MNDATPKPTQRSRAKVIAATTFALLLVCFAVFEVLEWPFLASPLQHFLSGALERQVSLSSTGATGGDAATKNRSFGVRFLGGIKIHSPYFEIAAPTWSKAPHFLAAHDVALTLRYIDLFNAHRGEHLRIDNLQAATLDGNLERRADGRASWQFGKYAGTSSESAELPEVPLFGNLEVGAGVLRYVDVPLHIDMQADLSLDNGSTTTTVGAAARSTENVFKVNAKGTYRALPLKFDLVSTGVLPWTAGATPVPVPVTLKATSGSTHLAFNGTATDAMQLSSMSGRFTLSGASLADAGTLLRVTLPTTGAFLTSGVVVKQGTTWRVLIDDATVGSSRLNGAFAYESRRAVPLLEGRLGGSRLLLSDLGPVIGSEPPATVTATAPASLSSITTSAASAKPRATKGKTTNPGRVLPDRKFELASLRVMDANILVDIAEVDLNTTLLEPLRPLHGHIQLADGILKLTDISARTAQGKFTGAWSLDGRGTTALWNADLRWDEVQLERWIHQTRSTAAAPAFVSGALTGRATVRGQGQSTAEILGTLKGRVHSELQNGTVSHLMVELGGLDIAESFGLLITGDRAIPVECAVTELVADGGVLRSQVTVIDTTDSTIWLEGTVSLASEGLDLRAVVTPKDFSPLTLRTPLLVRGSFAHPQVAIEKGTLGRKVGASILLGLLNPFAALLPLIDRGDTKVAAEKAMGCQALVQRGKDKLTSRNAIK